MNIQQYWAAAVAQDASHMRTFFHTDAIIRWHNTNEQFTVEEFLRANCEYPGTWYGELDRTEQLGDLLISVAHIYSVEPAESHHVVCFMQLKDDRIAAMDEYWSEDGAAPQWRLDKAIGTAIKS